MGKRYSKRDYLKRNCHPLDLREFLWNLPATGARGFEGLVRRLLEELIGLHFYSARSGDQHGRDSRANRPAGGSVAFECKRYRHSTPLEARDLISELQQARASLPNLDLWILAASRDIPDQIVEDLEAIARNDGIDILALECLSSGGGNLDVLCAAYPEIVNDFLFRNDTAHQDAAGQALTRERAKPGFGAKLHNLRETVLQPTCGWPTWRARSHEDWLKLMSSKDASRARLGQMVGVLAPESRPVRRASVERELDSWWEHHRREILAVLGDEGDGKTWAVAQWLTERVLNGGVTFPPVLFVPSRNAGEAKDVARLIETTLITRFGEHTWHHRVGRWLAAPLSRGDLPIALVVLDGINERHLPRYWRALIESGLDPEWHGMISIICTARTGFWQEHFGSLAHLPFISASVPPFTDEEADHALRLRGRSLSEFPEDLRPLLRKPRYLDLVTRYGDAVMQAGDFTPARLFFEDWRDRCSRRDRELSEEAFNDLLKQMAEHYRVGEASVPAGNLASMLSLDAHNADAIRELATGGVLVRQGGRWAVGKGRLLLGLGLLLSEELRNVDSRSRNLREEIASWLEPHTGSDFEAQIVEYALLGAASSGAEQAIIAELLLAWINTQNQRSPKRSPIERRLCAYVPQTFDAYVAVAEEVWSSKGDNPWAQEVLLGGFMHWSSRSDEVRSRLVPVMERWMGMVPIGGPPIKREAANNAAKMEELRLSLRDLFGDVHAGETRTLAGYPLTIISDDGWLRLARTSLAIISHLEDRRPSVRALVIGVLADSVYDFPDKADDIEWVIRSSRIPLEDEIKIQVHAVSSETKRTVRKAIARLLNYVGTESAWIARNRLDPDSLFPTPEWVVEAKKNPVESIFRCTAKDLEEYCRGDRFNPWIFLRSAADLVPEPSLEFPDDIGQRMSPVVGQLHELKFWQDRWRSGEDLQLEQAEKVLARVNPKGIAEVIRGVIKGAGGRTPEALAAMAFRIDHYDLLLDFSSRKMLWDILSSSPLFSPLQQDIAKWIESQLFQAALPLWSGNEQLRQLLDRPEDAFDARDFEWAYQGVVQPPVETPVTDKGQFRLLHYLGTMRANVLSSEQATSACRQQNSLVRGVAFRYLYLCDRDQKLTDQLVAEWTWNPQQHFLEQTYGSLVLIDSMRSRRDSEWVQRVDPSYRGTALQACQADDKAWIEYAHWLDHTLKLLTQSQVPGTLQSVHVRYSGHEPKGPGDVRIPDEGSQTIRFIRPESTWGGRLSEGTPDFGVDAESMVQERKEQYQELARQEVAAAAAGNHWLHRCFPKDGFDEVIRTTPELVMAWTAEVTDAGMGVIPPQANSFYVALDEVLLQDVGWHGTAVALYRALKRSPSGVRVVETGTQLDHLEHVLFNIPVSPEVLVLWNERYNLCSTDRDLLELALLLRSASRADAMTWWKQLLDVQLSSPVPFDSAKAAALRGFVEDNPAALWMQGTVEEEVPWQREVVSTAKARVHSEQTARYWFGRFCSSGDRDQAWSAFRLFLTCADRRCWLWCRHELANKQAGKTKESFFDLNIRRIEKACEENEKKLTESFLNCKVNDGLSPWLT